DVRAYRVARGLRTHPMPRARHRGLRGSFSVDRAVDPADGHHPRRAPARGRGRSPLPEPDAPCRSAGAGRSVLRRAQPRVSARDVGLGVLVAIIWGLAFVATRLGLDSFSPPQLAALRFLIAGAAAIVLPRPPVPFALLVATGLTLYAGQFLFQFFGIANGISPGLASFVVQTQALFTVLFAAVVLGERPTARQTTGMALACAGLVLIA